jgi:RNA polymerase sigma-54 factor
MRLDVSQQMRMEQRMVMAPRMIQSMEILQLPLMALQERIEQEMLSNPLLEIEPPTASEETGEAASSENTSAETLSEQENPEAEKALLIREDNSKKEDFARLDNLDQDFDEYLARSTYQKPRPGGGDPDKKLEAMQNTAAPGKSLNEYLLEQWAFVECDPLIRKIGTAIIEFIDESGYLTTPLDQIAPHVRKPVTPQQMEQALSLVQTLEPPGVGARNLAECLIIQLQNSPDDHTLEIELIRNHLRDIEMNRFPAVARKVGCPLEDIHKAIKVISRLDTRPGLQIGSHNTPYIIPEIIVEYDTTNDTYQARLSDGTIPNLQINTSYAQMLQRGGLTGEAKEYVQNNLRSARWLIESIEQRKQTLLRVVHHVLTTQREFFDRGPLYLKPLPMVEVAQSLGIHVGTVSRAVSGKYMQTPTGIYPLRFFFSGGTETAAGDSVSWDAVKAKLQGIIDEEDKKNPLSDDDLVRELEKQGITLARRTVAKYRSLMNIPPARRRKHHD